MSISVLRSRLTRTVLTFIALAVLVAAVTFQLSLHATAKADPYPPSNGGGSGVGGLTVHQEQAQQTQPSRSSTGRTAYTGFDSAAASAIAVALLGGGILLVVAGRRRRSDT